MGINGSLKVLYDTWRHQYTSFISGGVIDEIRYTSAELKVLFLLKEVNSDDPYWSLIDLISDQMKNERLSEIWKTLALWYMFFTTGLTSFKTITSQASYMFDSGYVDALEDIAFTNIKKTCGKAKSNWTDIMDYAKRDKAFLLQEIDIIDPKCIICCGTFDIAASAFSLDIQQCDSGAFYAICDDRVYLEMPHPKARVHKKILFSHFKETILELQGKNIL